MKDAIAGGIIGIIVTLCVVAYLEWRSTPKPQPSDPPHRLTGNYFDARAPFRIERVIEPVVEERSDAHIERVALRLGRIAKRRWANGDGDASARR